MGERSYFLLMKKIFLCILLFSLSVFCEKTSFLPRYQAESRIDADVAKFLDESDSLYDNIINKIASKQTARDILGRLSRDTTVYVLREDLFEKRILVGIIDLTPHNKPDKYAVDFQRDQYGNIIIRVNGKEVSFEEYRKIIRLEPDRETPFVRYDFLTANEIKSLVSGPKPIRIFLKKKVFAKYDEYYTGYIGIFYYSGVYDMHLIGAKGSGVGLFFEEGGCPYADMINQNLYIQSGNCLTPQMHATKVVHLMQLTAPEAMVVGFDGFDPVVSIVDHNANLFNPKLEIGSYSWHHNDVSCLNSSYCFVDEELDQHIYEDRLIYFVAAGNMDDSLDVYVGSPGKALNAITVGAVRSHTESYIPESKWKNSEIRNQKPEIAHYTNFSLENPSVEFFNGTSASTAYSAAIAANILSKDSNLKRHPEVIKAMFLMNATKPIVGASSHDIDDWFSVASKMPYFDVNSAYRYRWWSGSNTNVFNNNEKIVFNETGIVSGQHCRAAISWLTSGLYAGEYKLLAQDIDLFVYQGGTEPIASSISAYNPFEVVDFNTQNNNDLTIEIKRFANSYSDDVALGFTMRCENE